MSPLDREFRRRVSATFELWIDAFAKLLERGQEKRTVRTDVDARRVATFLVASIEGCFGLAKSAGSETMLRANLETLSFFLEGLRREPRARTKSGRKA
jgi:hypothetical protein